MATLTSPQETIIPGLPLEGAAPWVCRASIAHWVWRETDGAVPTRLVLPALWTESNGSEGCCGGWQLTFRVPGATGDEFLFELEAETDGLARGPDSLGVEAFWFGPGDPGRGESSRNWDPVLLNHAAPDGDGRLCIRFAKRLTFPAGADRLAVRCGVRWTPSGRVRWHGWRLRRLPAVARRTLRLGVASGRLARWEGREANAAHYLRLCRLAGEAGADWVWGPEIRSAKRSAPVGLPGVALHHLHRRLLALAARAEPYAGRVGVHSRAPGPPT